MNRQFRQSKKLLLIECKKIFMDGLIFNPIIIISQIAITWEENNLFKLAGKCRNILKPLRICKALDKEMIKSDSTSKKESKNSLINTDLCFLTKPVLPLTCKNSQKIFPSWCQKLQILVLFILDILKVEVQSQLPKTSQICLNLAISKKYRSSSKPHKYSKWSHKETTKNLTD